MLAFADPYQTCHREIGPFTVFKLGENKIRGQAKGLHDRNHGPSQKFGAEFAQGIRWVKLAEGRGCFPHVCPYLSRSFAAFVIDHSDCSSWRTVSHLNAHPSSRSTIHASTPGSKVILSQQWESHRQSAQRTPNKRLMSLRRSAGRFGSNIGRVSRCVFQVYVCMCMVTIEK